LRAGAGRRTPAVRELKLDKGHGYADYLLFLDGKAVGVCEAKPAGFLVRNVEAPRRILGACRRGPCTPSGDCRDRLSDEQVRQVLESAMRVNYDAETAEGS
jgi:hypothetical protein